MIEKLNELLLYMQQFDNAAIICLTNKLADILCWRQGETNDSARY